MAFTNLNEKKAFFKQLEALSDSSENDDTTISKKDEILRRRSRDYFHDSARHTATSSSTNSSPKTVTKKRIPTALSIEATPAVVKATQPQQVLIPASDSSFVAETPLPSQKHSTTERNNSHPPARRGESSSMSSKMTKRKRGSADKQVPEAQQLFKGLSFYYIPNDDVSPVRKLRIAKAKEYGAQWVRTPEAATHIIVDQKLVYDDIKATISTYPNIPSSPFLVNDNYPVLCLSFRALLNPQQSQFLVPGCPDPAVQEVSSPALTNEPPPSSEESLKLKAPQRNPSRWDYVPASGTPLRSEEPSVQSVGRRAGHSASLPVSEPSSSVIPSSQARDQPSPRQSQSDELLECTELLQQYKDLPLDDEEDDTGSDTGTARSVISSDSGSEEESSQKIRPSSARITRSMKKDISFSERFGCNQGGTIDKDKNEHAANKRTIEILQQMCDYYTKINDHWRMTAYRKAITTLRRQDFWVKTEEDALKLPGIGPRLAKKIEEIVSTDRLKRLEHAQKEPMDEVLQLYLGIYGVGNSQANKWIAQGFRTLDDLKQKAKLSPNQRMGIDHYTDLNTRIPRGEVKALGDYVKSQAAEIDPDVEILIGGSYRRGSSSSGDIDLIVTKKQTTSAGDLVPFLLELVRVLKQQGFLVATVAALHSHRSRKEGPGSKWHGCCVLPQPRNGTVVTNDRNQTPLWRRIDFLLVPETEFGAALIYFTGNDIFNRSMRLLASKKGMRLNQRGLYKDVIRGPGRAKVTEGELVEGKDEKKIFQILGVTWREPRERWC